MRQYIDRNNHSTPIGSLNTAATQVLNGTSASAAATAFDTVQDTPVMLTSLEAYHYSIGASPTATSTTGLVPGGIALSIYIPAGQTIAVLKHTDSTAGIVHVTPYLK